MDTSTTCDTLKAPEKKHSLLTIPTEILEKIASFSDSKDILNLRLANKEVAERTFDAFAADFLNRLHISIPRTYVQIMSGFQLSPKFAPAVKHLTVSLFGIDDEDSLMEDFAGDAGMLQNLRSLTIHWCSWRYRAHISIKLPQLERLAVENCYRLDCQIVVALIEDHKTSLKSVFIKNMDLYRYGIKEKPLWFEILDAARTLRPEAQLEVSLPRVGSRSMPSAFVTFSPLPEAFDPEIDPLDIFIGDKHNLPGLHYSTKPGHLQVSIDFMMLNYKVLYNSEDAARYGAHGYIVESTEDEEEDDEDEDNENEDDEDEVNEDEVNEDEDAD